MAPDRSVLMIDLPGFGESDRPVFGSDPERDWMDALKEVFSSELGSRFWLSGHSFGAYLAARMCLEGDSRICGLILLDLGFKIGQTKFERQNLVDKV